MLSSLIYYDIYNSSVTLVQIGSSCFVVTNVPNQFLNHNLDLSLETKVHCLVCGLEVQLRSMRRHVGKHILWDMRCQKEDPIVPDIVPLVSMFKIMTYYLFNLTRLESCHVGFAVSKAAKQRSRSRRREPFQLFHQRACTTPLLIIKLHHLTEMTTV